MQDKQLSSFLRKVPKGKLLQAIKIAITVFIFSYLYNTINQEHFQWSSIQKAFQNSFQWKHATFLFLLIALVPLNWALESYKWMLLAREAIPISFAEAFRSTLTGLAVGVAVPAQLGDTLGRVASLPSTERMRTIGAALVSNGIQFYVALVAGLIGLWLLPHRLPFSQEWENYGQLGLLFLVFLGIVVATYRQQLMNFPKQSKWSQKLGEYLEVISHYSTRALVRALGIGTLRYLVFLAQYVLIFSIFEIAVNLWELAALVTILLLAKTIIPAINSLGDLGIRGLVILWVFQNYSLPPEPLMTATILMWCVNIFAPLIVGIYFVWKYNWKIQF